MVPRWGWVVGRTPIYWLARGKIIQNLNLKKKPMPQRTKEKAKRNEMKGETGGEGR